MPDSVFEPYEMDWPPNPCCEGSIRDLYPGWKGFEGFWLLNPLKPLTMNCFGAYPVILHCQAFEAQLFEAQLFEAISWGVFVIGLSGFWSVKSWFSAY
jgi:hypothetical protein